MLEPFSPVAGRRDVERSGSVLTVVKSDEVVVWLIGEVDPAVAAELDEVADQAPWVARWLTIDGSRVTYCDTTVLRFISRVTESMYVIIRRPSPILAELLALSGLDQRVLVGSGPDDR